ncbi:MAG: protein tyrosine phosphatase family protein [Poseidonibacter sp.]|uniref:protein tyrosine phosphatase family protein n=1 Tax=Poseidonibacter sp. TaxID=2321188 RepID=UPI00359E638C
MQNILNYVKINELISTSGQPSEEEFSKIAQDGFEVVINLALHNASNAIKNEDKIVTDLDMSYFHIPVDFENPKISDIKLFLNILQSLGANKVWVHCALNYRVTAFMYVYHKYVLNTPFDEIDISMFEQWSPNKKWQELMKVSLEELQKS